MQEAIEALPEEALTRDIIIPLLQEMGYKNVRYVHGTFEHGVDIVCTEETPFGTEFCGIQVKAVPIHGTKARKEGNVAELINQASSALRHRFVDERDNTEKRLDKYFFMTSASITDVAAVNIRDALTEFGRIVRFIDGQTLTQLVQNSLRSYVTDYFARRDMITELGHVLRTPLQGIIGDLEWLRFLLVNGNAEDRPFLAIGRAEANIQDISRRIRSYIQAVAPPKTIGKTYRRINVEHIVSTVLHVFEARARMRGITITLISKALHPVISDPDAFELIVANLVDNAVRYSSENKEVIVSLSQQDKCVTVMVENTGILILESEMPLIWERFYRGTAAMDPRRFQPGTGVGLSVVKSLVEELGGTVKVTCQQTEGENTIPAIGVIRFTVSLPYNDQEGTI
jgi:signal transduction histidine kinase